MAVRCCRLFEVCLALSCKLISLQGEVVTLPQSSSRKLTWLHVLEVQRGSLEQGARDFSAHLLEEPTKATSGSVDLEPCSVGL